MTYITLRKVKAKLNPGPPKGMWVASCWLHSPSPISIQYWDFGATLGAVQEHIRREHREG